MGKLRLKITIDERSVTLYSDNKSNIITYEWKKDAKKSNDVITDNVLKGIVDKTEKITIKKLQFKKEVYKPCEIEAVTQISLNKGYKISRQEIVYLFKGEDGQKNEVSLKRVNGNEIINIADDYYIHEIIPQYFKTGEILVTLKIFSRDKLLTIDKYCNAYTGRKFFTNIINANFPKVFNSTDNIISEADIKVDTTNIVDPVNDDQNRARLTGTGSRKLVFLGYNYDKNANEYIQPYLVQYNESFYDFMVRVANRCGEFVFFENGKLCIGFDDKNGNTPRKISEYDSISYKDVSNGIVVPNDFTHYCKGSVVTDGKKKDESDDYIGKKRVYNTEMPTEDYLDVLEKDGFSSYKEELKNTWGSELFSFVTMVVLDKEPSLYKKLLLAGLRETVYLAFTPLIVKEKNDEGNKKYINKKPDDQTIGKYLKSAQFSTIKDRTIGELNFKQEFNSLFYSTVRTAEKEVSENAVIIDLGVNMTDVKLGDMVTIDTEGDKHYIVIGIEGNSYVDDKDTQTNFRLTLIPCYTYDGTEIECPPLVIEDPIRHASPQVAIIADSDDPEGIGRVRIRYPWQMKDSDPSPWIRMTTPFATDGGGMYFKPNEGDEVLVDYENGNIERPYVTGALYTGNVNVPDGERIISSANGHSIKMTDPETIDDFLDNLWGGSTLLNALQVKQIKGLPWAKEDKVGLTGGMELTDRYGIYSVSMSSSERSISISSPFGDVNIDAFTGITLSAPNGSITIEGKDINIVAGNTLRLSSGENIPDVNPELELETEDEQDFKDSRKSDKIESYFEGVYENLPEYVQPVTNFVAALIRTFDGWDNFRKQTLKNAAIETFIMPFADLELVRTLIEAIIKPTAGTMIIKSWRYMMLEAGFGRAYVPDEAYTDVGYERLQENATVKSLVRAKEDLKKIKGNANLWLTEISQKFRNLNTGYDAVKNAFIDMDIDFPEDEIKKVIKNAKKPKTKKDYKYDNFVTVDSYTNTDAKRDAALTSIANLNNYAVDINNSLKDVNEIITKDLDNKDKKFICTISCPEHISGKDFTTLMTKNENYFTNIVKFKKFVRKMYIDYLKVTDYITFNDKLNTDELADDDEWRKLTFSVDYKEPDISIRTIGAQLKQATNLRYWVKSRDVWGELERGQILMSDKRNITINFDENGDVRFSENKEYYNEAIDGVIKILNQI